MIYNYTPLRHTHDISKNSEQIRSNIKANYPSLFVLFSSGRNVRNLVYWILSRLPASSAAVIEPVNASDLMQECDISRGCEAHAKYTIALLPETLWECEMYKEQTYKI